MSDKVVLSMFSNTNIQVDSTAKLPLTVDEVYFYNLVVCNVWLIIFLAPVFGMKKKKKMAMNAGMHVLFPAAFIV